VHAGELGRGDSHASRTAATERCLLDSRVKKRIAALVGGVSFCFVVNKKGNMDKESLLSWQNEYGRRVSVKMPVDVQEAAGAVPPHAQVPAEIRAN